MLCSLIISATLTSCLRLFAAAVAVVVAVAAEVYISNGISDKSVSKSLNKNVLGAQQHVFF